MADCLPASCDIEETGLPVPISEAVEVSNSPDDSTIKAQAPIQLCEVCPPVDRADASFVCLDCPPGKHFWCGGCMRVHRVTAPSHKVVGCSAHEEDLKKYQCTEDAGEGDVCPKHPGKKVVQSCRGCMELLCPLCVSEKCKRGPSDGQQHKVGPLSETSDELKSQLTKSIDEAKGKLFKLSGIVTQLNLQKKVLSTNLDQNREAIASIQKVKVHQSNQLNEAKLQEYKKQIEECKKRIEASLKELEQTTKNIEGLGQKLTQGACTIMNPYTATVDLRLSKADATLDVLKADISEAEALASTQNHMRVHRKALELSDRLKKVSVKEKPLPHLPVQLHYCHSMKVEAKSLPQVTSGFLGKLLLITHKVLPKLSVSTRTLGQLIPTQCASYRSGSMFYLLEVFAYESGLYLTSGDGNRKEVDRDTHFGVCCSGGATVYTSSRIKSDYFGLRKYKIEDGCALPNKTRKNLNVRCKAKFWQSHLSVRPGSSGFLVGTCNYCIHTFTPELKHSRAFTPKEIGLSTMARSTNINKILIATWGRSDQEVIVALSDSTVALVNLIIKNSKWCTPIPDVRTIQLIGDLVYCMQPALKKMTVLSIEEGEVTMEVQCPGMPVHVFAKDSADRDVEVISYE